MMSSLKFIISTISYKTFLRSQIVFLPRAFLGHLVVSEIYIGMAGYLNLAPMAGFPGSFHQAQPHRSTFMLGSLPRMTFMSSLK